MFNKIVKPKMKETENREQAILRAAEREFTTRGFDGAKTTSIAEAAGVTHALLHYYFRTKEKLYERVLDDIVSRLEASIVEAFAASGAPFTSRLEEGLRRHFLFLLDHPDLPRFLIHEIGARPERVALVRARMGRLVGRVFASMQADMERQAAQGESACVGPVSPTPTRLLEGVRTAGFARKDRLSPVQPPHYARLLEACGARVVRRDGLYEISVPQDARIWARMAARFGATGAVCGASREVCAQVAQIAGVAEEPMARVLCALPRPKIAIARVRGELAGYMIVLPNGRLRRIAEARILPAYQRRGAIAALVCAVLPLLGRVAEAGVIDAENRASTLLAEHAGGRKVAEFAFYRLE